MIHGGTPDIHLMKTVEAFGTGTAPMRMLLATDVASEGINLHHQCHHIIHYDLPWSIITLIQRNGRIDRFGQKQTPVLRYLMVDTENGLLAGDSAIFERLVEKVEEINRSTRAGRDRPQALRSRGRGTLHRRARRPRRATPASSKGGRHRTGEAGELEATLDAANLRADDDFLEFLLGGKTATTAPAAEEDR